MAPDQSHSQLCHPSPRIINMRLLQHISYICLPCGFSLYLTNSASKHSPKCTSEVWPMWLTPDREGGGTGQGNVCTQEVRCQGGDRGTRVSLPSSLCLFGWRRGAAKEGRNVFFSSFLFLKSMSIHPIPGKTTPPPPPPPPTVSKSYDFEKHPSSLLLLSSVWSSN